MYKTQNMALAVRMNRKPPPLVIDSARVLSYAFVEDIEYRKAGALYSNDKLIEKVPCLAICVNLGEDIGPMLFHCDEEWNALGTLGADTIDEVKSRAERNYPGVDKRWTDTNVSVETALAFYDSQTDNMRCSFCGKRPFEVTTWVQGKTAIICSNCVTEFHRDLESGSNSTGG